MEMKFCQSCGMPVSNEVYGTNKDGTANEDYCKYCYAGGMFTADCTMEEMIEFCVPHMTSANEGMSPETARSQMNQYFPRLKRWRK